MRIQVCLLVLWWIRSASSFAGRQPAKFSVVGRFQLTTNHRKQPLLQVSFPVDVESEYSPTMADRVKHLCQKYVSLNERRPLATKGVTAAIVQGLGDVLSQYLTLLAKRQPFQWNMMRTLTFVIIGLCYKGPMLHVWYKTLTRVSRWTKIQRGFSATQQSLTALTLDQTVGVAIFYPLYYVAYEFFSSVVAFQGTFHSLVPQGASRKSVLLMCFFLQ